jgi:hypothetical protein
MSTCSRKTRNQRPVYREKLTRTLNRQQEEVKKKRLNRSLNRFRRTTRTVTATNCRMRINTLSKVWYFVLILDISINEMFNIGDLKNEEYMVSSILTKIKIIKEKFTQIIKVYII